MEGPAADPEALAAYYCFVNFGWKPSEYEELPLRERFLVSAFMAKELRSRDKDQGGVN